MKAYALEPAQKGSGELIEVPQPKISGEKEVVVKTISVGIDGTDREISEGRHGESPHGSDHLIVGHEALGTVSDPGSSSLKEGELVVPTVRRPDDCINCKAGEYDMCLKGDYKERGIKGMHGYLSQYFVEKEGFLIRIPEEIGSYGVLLEPLSVIEKAVRIAYQVQTRLTWKPETALITGSGSLGLMTAALLKLKGLDVVIVDRSDDPYKEKIFSMLELKHFNTRKINLHDIPGELGKQVDMIFEETGSSSVALHSMSVVGTNGVVILLSLTGGSKKIEICSDCLNQGLVLGNKAVVGSVSSNIRDFRKGIDDMKEIKKRWPDFFQKMITARFEFQESKKAIEAIEENIKVIIDLQGK